MNVKTVTVIGANGTMGANVSGIFAAFGNARVYMVCRDIEKARKAAAAAGKSVRAESIVRNLIPADYSQLEACVAQSDFVFESVAEDMALKKEINQKIAGSLRPGALVGTGTSGLSVTELAGCFPEELRTHYFGVHFFNPPYNLTLCEVIPTRFSDRTILSQLCDYLHKVLYRTVVVVDDSPAFLANRIGFEFINRAAQYADRYRDNGGVDYMDALLGPFTGRAMAPLVTLDFVGLDVHRAIVDNIYQNSCDRAHETFLLPDYIKQLISDGRLGRKAGEGLYKREVRDDGSRHSLVYDIAAGQYREPVQYHFLFAQEMQEQLRVGNYEKALRVLVLNRSAEAEICLSFLLEYIAYSVETALAVSEDIAAADDCMATGFNWCPPLALAGALGQVCELSALFEERLPGRVGEEVLAALKPSRYDFRSYFKARG